MKHVAALLLMLTLAAASAATTQTSFPLTENSLVDLPRVVAVLDHDQLYPQQTRLMVEGPTIEAVLRLAFPNLLEYARTGYAVQFQRREGEAVTIKISDLIGTGAVLAMTDYEAAGGGKMWMRTQYQGRTLSTSDIAYYLVWPNQPNKPSFWGITRLDLISPSVK